jgi:hypothetical protein
VIVDAQPPVIKLDAQRGAAGEIAVRYEVTDAALQPQSLAMSYQLVGMTEWRTVAFDKPFGAMPEKPLQGSTTFWPERAGVELLVKLEILDAAGNTGTAQVAVPIARGVPAQPVRQPFADATTPWNGQASAPSTPPQNGGLQNLGQPNPALQNPALAALPGGRNDDPPPAFPFGDTSRSGGTRWNDVTNPAPTPRLAPPQDLSPSTPPANIAALPSGPALFGPQDNPPPYPGNNNSIAALPQQQPLSSPIAPRVESRVAAPYEPLPTTGLREYRLPSGEQPRMVNGRTFEWDYELESVGAAGIAKIELWMTRDGGASWASVGVDPDNRSPVRTMVDGEGLYGYRMTVQSAGGAQPRSPQSGEQPEMWIGVDLTKPAVRLINAELGQGSAQGEIAITWEASDALLAKQPVSLAYSERPDGPWTTIAAGLENTGRYAWRYDSQTPERLYLRLEVRDEAGNIGMSESIEPLSLERTNPAVRLKNVRPVQEGNPQSRLTPPAKTARMVATQPEVRATTSVPTEAISARPATRALPNMTGPLPIVLPSPDSMSSNPRVTTAISTPVAQPNTTTTANTRPAVNPTTPNTPRSTVWTTPTNANPSTMTNPYLQQEDRTIRR